MRGSTYRLLSVLAVFGVPGRVRCRLLARSLVPLRTCISIMRVHICSDENNEAKYELTVPAGPSAYRSSSSSERSSYSFPRSKACSLCSRGIDGTSSSTSFSWSRTTTEGVASCSSPAVATRTELDRTIERIVYVLFAVQSTASSSEFPLMLRLL